MPRSRPSMIEFVTAAVGLAAAVIGLLTLVAGRSDVGAEPSTARPIVPASHPGPAETPATPDAPGPPVVHDPSEIVIRSVEVNEVDADGRPWDLAGGKPDLKVVVRNTRTGETYTSPVSEDTYEATLDRTAMRVDEGDTLEFVVEDVDLNFDDLVGKVEKRLTGRVLEDGEHTWSFGQVLALEVEFK